MSTYSVEIGLANWFYTDVQYFLFWLMFIDSDCCWLIEIDSDWCSSILIDADWLMLMLIDLVNLTDADSDTNNDADYYYCVEQKSPV